MMSSPSVKGNYRKPTVEDELDSKYPIVPYSRRDRKLNKQRKYPQSRPDTASLTVSDTIESQSDQDKPTILHTLPEISPFVPYGGFPSLRDLPGAKRRTPKSATSSNSARSSTNSNTSTWSTSSSTGNSSTSTWSTASYDDESNYGEDPGRREELLAADHHRILDDNRMRYPKDISYVPYTFQSLQERFGEYPKEASYVPNTSRSVGEYHDETDTKITIVNRSYAATNRKNYRRRMPDVMPPHQNTQQGNGDGSLKMPRRTQSERRYYDSDQSFHLKNYLDRHIISGASSDQGTKSLIDRPEIPESFQKKQVSSMYNPQVSRIEDNTENSEEDLLGTVEIGATATHDQTTLLPESSVGPPQSDVQEAAMDEEETTSNSMGLDFIKDAAETPKSSNPLQPMGEVVEVARIIPVRKMLPLQHLSRVQDLAFAETSTVDILSSPEMFDEECRLRMVQHAINEYIKDFGIENIRRILEEIVERTGPPKMHGIIDDQYSPASKSFTAVSTLDSLLEIPDSPRLGSATDQNKTSVATALKAQVSQIFAAGEDLLLGLQISFLGLQWLTMANEPNSQALDLAVQTQVSKFFSTVESILRWEPKIKQDRTRIHWKCKCGKALYDDFQELQPGAAKRFEEYLNDNSGTSDSGSRTTISTGRSLSSAVSSSLETLKNMFSKKSPDLPLREPPALPGNTEPMTPPASPTEGLFLLLCHSEGLYTTRLLQLPISDILSDNAFFTTLRASYTSMRKHWISNLSFRTLTGIKFVRFEIYMKSQTVDVRRTDDIPPPGHSEYRYQPVPIDIMPPVGENQLMHFFQHPNHAEDDPRCLGRIPKKIRDRLAADEKNPSGLGWGLQLVEGPDLARIWTAGFVIFVVGSGVLGVVWMVMKRSVQDAFAVATYVLGLAVVTIGFVQARAGYWR